MQNLRQVSLLTSGQEQVLTIPPELALSSTEVFPVRLNCQTPDDY